MRSPRRRLLVLSAAIFLVLFLWISAIRLTTNIHQKSSLRLGSSNIGPHREPLSSKNNKGFSEEAYRVVHLDLKGAPPSLPYLRRLLPILAEHGADCLLIEYEDMFPYRGPLVNISAKNAYTMPQVRRLLSWAHDLGLEVIPLLQTFGHMEHVLKLEEWRSLRELASFPQELCPSNPGSLPLVEEMIAQVMAVHKGSAKYIHLGADEVFHIAACAQCSLYTSREVYLRYVTTVAELVHRKYPGVTPIIWDDMLRTWIPSLPPSSPLTALVEPMIWAYTPEVTTLVPYWVWHWYSTAFRRVWVASAFKGATLPTSDLPSTEIHYRNTASWLDYVGRSEVQIAGIVLTGWSRYDHFAVLCELLPVAMPSLLLNLITISRQHIHKSEQEIFSIWRRQLQCPSSTNFTPYSLNRDQAQLTTCKFLGSDLLASTLKYIVYKIKAESLHTTITNHKGWMTRYNVKHNFTSPFRIVELYSSLRTQTLMDELQLFKNQTRTLLLSYFDSYSAEEWLEQKIAPLEDKLTSLAKSMESLLLRDVWPRRPL